MKKADRIRLYGSRLNRFTYRFFIFIGWLALYSLVTGASTDPEGGRLVGLVVVVALLIGIAYGWFSARDQRNIDRSHQLAAEVTLLYPDASAEELNHAYTLRRRREMRLEALLYLIFAVFSAIWFWVMYAIDALPVSWAIGWLIITPGLLLIALILLIRSVIPVKNDEEMPSVSKQDLELAQNALKKRMYSLIGKGIFLSAN